MKLEEFPAPRRGRPRKFSRPSRAVTLTLPEDVIAALQAVDPDLSRAVVRVAQRGLGEEVHPAAELATFGRRAVILVKPTPTFERRTGVMLVPLTDGRALLAFDEAMTPARLELAIEDALEDPTLPPGDHKVYLEIRRLLKEARRSNLVVPGQRHIIVLEQRRRVIRRRRSRS